MADIKLLRLLRATMRFVDRHAERKSGPGVIDVPLLPHNDLMALNRKRVEEITQNAPPTDDELQVRAYIQGIGIVTQVP